MTRRITLSPEQKKVYKVKDLAEWIDGRMHSKECENKVKAVA